MGYKTMQDVLDSMKGIAEIKDNRVRVFNETSVRSNLIDKLVFDAVFNKDTELRNKIRWLIRAIAHELGLALPLSRFNELNRKIPTLLSIRPVDPTGSSIFMRRGEFRR